MTAEKPIEKLNDWIKTWYGYSSENPQAESFREFQKLGNIITEIEKALAKKSKEMLDEYKIRIACEKELAKLKSEIADFTSLDTKKCCRKPPTSECACYFKGRDEFLSELEKKVKEMPNQYPKDIFMWNNKEKLPFNRGRFNEFNFKIFENFRQAVLEIIKEMER